jgi:hypothetical protein
MHTIAFLAFLLIISCKKDDVRSDDVTIGDYSNMQRRLYDTVIAFHGYPAGFNLDLDDDNTDDFSLISLLVGSPGSGYHTLSQINCLTGNALLSGYNTSDTTFYSFDRTVYTGSDSIVRVDEYYRFSCHHISDHDSIMNIASNSFKISVKHEQEKINQQDLFKADSLILNEDYVGFPPYEINKQDTIIRKYQVNYNDCNSWPLQTASYIGIKILKGNETKYGWIKLSVIDKNNIILFETAIQK